MPNLNINIPDSDETTKGIAEVASQVEVDTGTDDTRIITPNKLENSALRGEVTSNNAKVTNATHTGEVTGSGVLTVDKTSISNKTLVTAVAGDHVLVGDASDSDNLKKVDVTDFLGGGGLGVLMTFFPPVRFNAVDGVTYYFTQWINSGGESFANAVVLSPVSFTLTSATIQSVSSVGSNEAITFNIWVNGTPNTLSSTYTMDGTNNQLITGLSISIAAGDELVVGMVSPTWVTNPTAIRLSVNIYGS